jgi:UDP-3-O-[3-hydroxymyristoyl] glucosamine N-acyltransferase
MRLAEIATLLGLALEGDSALEITGLAGLADAGPRDLSFAVGEAFRRAFDASRGGAFLLPPSFDARGRACLRTPNPYGDFARAVDLFFPPRASLAAGVHPTAVVAPDAELAPDVAIGAFVVVGPRARIGARTAIHPHVTLYADVVVGSDCVIHSGAALREGVRIGDRVTVKNGAVIGTEGFGHVVLAGRGRVTIAHPCPVEIGADCEIGANAAIDASHPGQARRGHPETRTRIGAGVKIDNLVQVGHGCAVGDHSTLCAQVGLAGSTGVGRNVTFGGQAASAGHLEVGDGALVGARAAVGGDLESGAQVLGTPAMERRAWGRFIATRKRIPDLFARVRRIERRLGLRAGGDSGAEDA